MAQVLQSHFTSPQSSCSSSPPTTTSTNTTTTCLANNDTHQQQQQQCFIGGVHEEERDQELSVLALFVAAFRKSFIGCGGISGKELFPMEIGFPSNVRHVAHVTFDRFNGFLGLPAEFEPEVPRRPPSASANVFGVSTESMQLSFDSRGNTVPTILLLMQRRLYEQGGLQAEGIFRINGGNSQEEYVREELNRGVVPENVDVHCLAGLIKAWFRELPTGILDSLSPEQVMQSQSEEECVQLVRLLPPTEADLLDWAMNLMADVAQLEHINKMNARNVAMVFAPNMTKMADPLTALMYAVQVMNFLKTLIVKTLREREDSLLDTAPHLHPDPSDESGHRNSLEPVIEGVCEDCEPEENFITEEPNCECPTHSKQNESETETLSQSFFSSIKCILPRRNQPLVYNRGNEVESHITSPSSSCCSDGHQQGGTIGPTGDIPADISLCKIETEQSSNSYLMNGIKKRNVRFQAAAPLENQKGIITRINSRTELAEAWR